MAEGALSPQDKDAVRLARIMRAAALRAREAMLNPPGNSEKSRAFNMARASAQLRDLQRDLLALNVQANTIVSDRVRAEFERGVKLAEKLARESGLVAKDAPVLGSLTGAETRRAGVLVRNATSDINKAFRSMNNVAGRSIRQASALGLNRNKVKRILAGGTIDGMGPRTLQRLVKHFREISRDGFVEVPNKRTGGVIRFTPEYYADLVYQTANAEAANLGEIERQLARGAYYVKILGSQSKNFCTQFRGKVFYIGPGEDPLGLFPRLDTLPRGGAPFHPRCTKHYVPFNPKLASPAEIEAGKMTPQEKENTVGKTPAEAQKAFDESKPTPTPGPAPEPQPEPAQATPEAVPAVVPKSPVPAAPEAITPPQTPREVLDLHQRFGWSWKTWQDSLQPDQRQAIRRYQSQADFPVAGYNDVNRYLRHNRAPTGHDQAWVDSVIRGLDSAFENATLPFTVNSYRAIRASPELVDEWKSRFALNLPWPDKGYVSTSANPALGSVFFGTKQDFRNTIFEVLLPSGIRAIYPAAVTGTMAEQLEILLPRGSTFVIESIDESRDVIRVKARLFQP